MAEKSDSLKRGLRRYYYNLKEEVNEITKTHPKLATRTFYGVIIFTILIFVGYYGDLAANSEFPMGEFQKINFAGEEFQVEGNVTDIHNPGILLIRESEALQYDLKITNNNSTSKYFVVYVSVNQNGERMYNSKLNPIKIEGNSQNNTSIRAYFPNAGMNTVTITVEMYNVRTDSYDGEIDYFTGVVDSKANSFWHRIYTESDYKYHQERYVLLRFLWAVSAPFVILAIKHARDIAENKG